MIEYRGVTFYGFGWVVLFCAHAALLGASAVLLVVALRRQPFARREALLVSLWGAVVVAMTTSLALVGAEIMP